jgi:L-rhamnose mutarotase
MKRFCLVLDLKDDIDAIAAYEAHHRNVWPEIIESIKQSGIEYMTIYRVSNRLVMLLETTDDFSFERKATLDSKNPKVQEWEELMNNYQQKLPGTKAGEKWQLTNEIFSL